MKATGIVRRIDDLGRVVIPKEIRRTLRIREGDPLEIFTDREGEIILKKYSPIGELAAFAGMYADSLAKEAGCLVCICDMDQVVAASGNGRKEVQEKYISKVLQGELEERNSILAKVDEKKYIRVFRDGFVSMDMAQNILVIKTVSGMAMAVAAAIDAMHLHEIVGCIAGDDTIMCAVRSVDDTIEVIGRLRKLVEQ